MEDNYECDEKIVNPCEECKHRIYSNKCRTCKHRYKKRPFRPQYPNTTDGRLKILTE
jgi:hypothetical protein